MTGQALFRSLNLLIFSFAITSKPLIVVPLFKEIRFYHTSYDKHCKTKRA